jgi:membrane-associated phospholipid phosphatase
MRLGRLVTAMFPAAPPVVASRGLGELGVVATLPEPVVAAFGVLTQLGNPWLLLVLLTFAYLLADRVDASPARLAVVLALGFGALALTMSLKYAFQLPRPPGAAADGYGFPSGHALGATVVYGGLAALVPSRPRQRLALVGVAVGVAVSRVVIGVHYLVDVVAGAAVGVAFLAVVFSLVGSRETIAPADATRAFDATLVVAVAGFSLDAVLAGSLAVATEVLLGLGAAVGGWVGWRLVGDAVERLSLSRPAVGLNVVAVPVLVGVLRLVSETPLEPVVYVGATAVLVATLVACPVVSHRLVAVAK